MKDEPEGEQLHASSWDTTPHYGLIARRMSTGPCDLELSLQP